MSRGLSWDEQKKFIDLTTPGQPGNPFPPEHQARNYALWLTYYQTGISLVEGLALRGVDLTVNGHEQTIAVGDGEHTNVRRIPITNCLARVLHDFIVQTRRGYAAAKRSPYVFLDDAGPLGENDVLVMAEEIRLAMGEVDELSVSVLHMTWEERISKAVEESGLLHSEGEALKRYLRGTKLSRVEELSLRLQDKLFDHAAAKRPFGLETIKERAARADVKGALAILDKAAPSVPPDAGDELPHETSPGSDANKA